MRRTQAWARTICVVAIVAVCHERERHATAQLLPYPVDDEETVTQSELPAPSRAMEGTRQPQATTGAYLGVTFDPGVRSDALVRSVAATSPAARAGLAAGDVIESLNGRRVSSYEDVLSAIRWMKPGDALDIEVSRRVYVHVQPVLEGSPPESRQDADEGLGSPSSMRNDSLPASSLPEQLPVPVNYEQPRSRSAAQYSTGRSYLPRYNDASANRRTGDNRNRGSVDRSESGRNRGFLRRRRS